MLVIPALFRIAETGFVGRKMRRIDRGASPWLVTGSYQLPFLIAATDRMPVFEKSARKPRSPGAIA
jgi:hypothetical protein